MNGSEIWELYLQLFNQKLVLYNPHKVIVQDVFIKLHFQNNITDVLLNRGLKFINSDPKQYKYNVKSIQKQIFDINDVKKVTIPFEINLLYSAIFSGGFYESDELLLRIKFNLQKRDPSLKNIECSEIFHFFSKNWLIFLTEQKNKYTNILNYNPNTIPFHIKYFILSFIGYRFFSCGFPICLQTTLFDYFFDDVPFEQTVVSIVKNGNENQMNAFLSCLHVLFPTETIPEEDYLFSRLFNLSNSIESLNDESNANIISQCCKYSLKEFKININNSVNDFLQFSSNLICIMQPFFIPDSKDIPENIVEPNPDIFHLNDEEHSCDFDKSLGQAFLQNNQSEYESIIYNRFDIGFSIFQQFQTNFGIACSNTFNVLSFDHNEGDNINETENEQDRLNCISNQSNDDNLTVDIYEEDDLEEDLNEEKEDGNDEEYFQGNEKLNDLLSSLPAYDQIKFHVEKLLSLLTEEELTPEIEDLVKPLKIELDENEVSKNANMIGCFKSHWKQSMNNLRCKIARLTKKIHSYDAKIYVENEEKQIDYNQQEIYLAFKSIEPVLQKIILTKYKNKHYDLQSKIFWMNIFIINHSFFDLVKVILKTQSPSQTAVYRWFKKIVRYRFWDFQDIKCVSNILHYYSDNLKYKPGERFSLSFDAMKFSPGLQRSSLSEKFYGFTTDFSERGQIEIQKVIKDGTSPEDFLKICCENSFLGDYIFVFYLASLDRIEIKDVPIYIYVKKNGFANPIIHTIKKKLVDIIEECGFSIPYVFSDGDGIDQQMQMDIQNLWNPLFIQNCESFYYGEIISIDDCFFNFPVLLNDDISFLCTTDGMHLLKRIRYEIVKNKRLYLARKKGDLTQVVTFYVPDFQKIVKDICSSFVFCDDIQTKMDDDYPHEMFGGMMCQYLLNIVISNPNNDVGKNAFKWLVFCIIGASLDLVLNDNESIPKENHFAFQILGFFLMYKIQQNTVYLPNKTRLFTTQVMREYLNLFVVFFREYSNENSEKTLVEKMGSTHLEHFYATIRRNCYFDDHLISVSHAIERIIALRLIRESDEMKWFETINRRKIKPPVSNKNYKWDWEISGHIFILADDIFESLMSLENDFPHHLLDQIFYILNGKNNGNDQSENLNIGDDKSIKLYSLSDLSFKNKGSKAKSRLIIGSKGMFKTSQKKNKVIQKTPKTNVKDDRLNEQKYYGPAFYMEYGSNLCFFNQALQTLLHYKVIFEWMQDKTPSLINSPILIHLLFISIDYYSFSRDPYILELDSAYYSLVDSYFENSTYQKGDMGDIADVYSFILNEFKKEKTISKGNFSSLFEITIKTAEYDGENENIYTNRLPMIYLSDEISINSNFIEKEIYIPEIKRKEKDNNLKKWASLNLHPINQSQFIPNETHQTESISQSIYAIIYAISPQMTKFYSCIENKQDEHDFIIESDHVQYCVQTIINFPQYLFLKLNHTSQLKYKNYIIEEKLSFIQVDTNQIEYELINLTFFSHEHFYSLHRCWNSKDGPAWIHYNDPEPPILFNGFLDEALINFGLDICNAVVYVYIKM